MVFVTLSSPRAAIFLVATLALLINSSAFVVTYGSSTISSSTNQLFMSTTVIPGTETETEKREKELRPGEEKTPTPEADSSGAGNKGPIEWLIDDAQVSRDDNDPFHILLLDETFNNAKITIEYVASTCTYVLTMPYDEAAELAAHAEQEGFSCLGTWGYQECIRLGKQLQKRDLVCRVVPYCEGGDRAWQARNMRDEVWEI